MNIHSVFLLLRGMRGIIHLGFLAYLLTYYLLTTYLPT